MSMSGKLQFGSLYLLSNSAFRLLPSIRHTNQQFTVYHRLFSGGDATPRRSNVLNSASQPASQEDGFRFPPLEHKYSIRILVLEPALNFEADLKGSIRDVRLDEKPEYEAISYTWGQAVFPAQLQLANGKLGITENLANALRQFRPKDLPRNLWADAVCINQKDNKERARHVKIMSLIYKCSKKALLWLGEETPYTRSAVQFLEEKGKSPGLSVVRQGHNYKHWWRGPPALVASFKDGAEVLKRARENHIQDLYGRDWFTRLWIVQEVTLAREAVLCCGSQQLNWETFSSAMLFLMAAMNTLNLSLDEMPSVERVGNIIAIREHYHDIDEIRPPLFVSNYRFFGKYMYKLRDQNCTDSRDRVYALLGLRPWFYKLIKVNVFDIEPDYNKPAFEVYREWARQLTRTPDLDFLLDAGIWQRHVYMNSGGFEFHNMGTKSKKGIWREIESDSTSSGEGVAKKRPREMLNVIRAKSGDGDPLSGTAIVSPTIIDLPSWVPDLSNTGKKPGSLPWTNLHGLDEFCARTNTPDGSYQNVRWESEADKTSQRIWVKAVLLDQIEWQTMIHEYDDKADYSHLEYVRTAVGTCKMLFDSLVKRDNSTPWPYSEEPETVFARTIVSDGSGISFQGVWGKSDADGKLGTIADPKYLRSLWKIYNFMKKLQTIVQNASCLNDIPQSVQRQLKIISQYHFCLSETLEGHVFFVTPRRFVGLAPLVAKWKDYIALIDSVRTPVVLRWVKAAGGKEGYVLVGPCYVHGVMYGETQPDSGKRLAKEGSYIPLI